MTLVSGAYDPDGVERTDLALENWAHWVGDPSDPTSEYRFLGSGRVVGPVLFEFSPAEHFLRLAVIDRERAEAESGCRFRVVDTTPPLAADRR